MGASMHAAQRTGQSTFDLSSLNLNLVPAAPSVISTNTREAQLSRRVKELEEELRAMRVENEKQASNLFLDFPLCAESVRAESHDCEIPGAMGQAQGVGETQARSQSSSGGPKRACSRAH
jgi:hypothetical protein